jgi:agmatinase
MQPVRRRGNFLSLDPEFSDLETAGVVVLPVPFERSSSYVWGSFRGPGAIVEASTELEEYDEELGREIYRLCGGIATLEPILFVGDTPEQAVARIEGAVTGLLEKGKFVVCLGGEHTCSLGPIRAFAQRVGSGLSVLQLDAHGDLRHAYLGDPYSHASVMARALECVSPVVQVGIRAQSQEEVVRDWQGRVQTFLAHPIRTGRMPDWQDRVLRVLGDRVYLTVDADFFDPSVIPSVGTPEPGGFLWYETLAFLRRLCTEKTVVGFDLCEFSPVDGVHHPDFTLARLVYKLIGYIWEGRGGSRPAGRDPITSG